VSQLDPRLDPHKDQPVHHLGEPLAGAHGLVILLHGRGASAQDILGLSRELAHPGLAYIAPDAANHTWYPTSFLAPQAQNEPFLTSALAKVKSIVDEAVASGIPTERIILCGFSQGACLSTEFIARNPARYGGLIALTGGLIGTDAEVSASTRPALLAGTPGLLLSGDPDPHVPWSRVEQSAAILEAMGADITTKRYPNRPHTVTRDELDLANQLVAAIAR
jgi:phospholipase/carboxylesterase